MIKHKVLLGLGILSVGTVIVFGLLTCRPRPVSPLPGPTQLASGTASTVVHVFPTPWPILATRGLPTPTPLDRPYLLPTVVPITATTAALLPPEEKMVYNAAWARIERGKSVGCRGCDEIIDIQVERIRKPEWEQLWPEVHFYLIKNIGAFRVEQRDTVANPYYRRLYAVHKGLLYGESEIGVVSHFNELLAANQIKVTDANRDLVTRAFILMGMDASRLAGDVTFSAPRTIDDEGIFSGDRLTYYVESWAQVQGLVTAWRFSFHPDGQINLVTGTNIRCSVGEYTPVSEAWLLCSVTGGDSHAYRLKPTSRN